MPTCVSTTYRCDICNKEFKGLGVKVLAKKCEDQGVLYEPTFSKEDGFLGRYSRASHGNVKERTIVIDKVFYEEGTHNLTYEIKTYYADGSLDDHCVISAEKIEKIIIVPGQKKVVSGLKDSAPKAV